MKNPALTLILLIAALVPISACKSGDPPEVEVEVKVEVEVCHFESGRPCRADTVCLGQPGNDCNYYSCVDGRLVGTAIGCAFDESREVPPIPGGPFECNAETIVKDPSTGPITPPVGCGTGEITSIVDNKWGPCVPIAQCNPIPCDPAFEDDGCPTTTGCHPDSRTCVPRGEELAAAN